MEDIGADQWQGYRGVHSLVAFHATSFGAPSVVPITGIELEQVGATFNTVLILY